MSFDTLIFMGKKTILKKNEFYMHINFTKLMIIFCFALILVRRDIV